MHPLGKILWWKFVESINNHFKFANVCIKRKHLSYLSINILFLQAFVDSNPTMKWCPSPGCGRAVRLPSSMLPSLHVAVEARSSEETEPIIVDCGHGHFFCW